MKIHVDTFNMNIKVIFPVVINKFFTSLTRTSHFLRKEYSLYVNSVPDIAKSSINFISLPLSINV